MLDKVTAIYKEVKAPEDRMCVNGHHIKEDTLFKGGDEFAEGRPVKFFSVMIDGSRKGVICELCLVIARHIARQNRKEKAEKEELK